MDIEILNGGTIDNIEMYDGADVSINGGQLQAGQLVIVIDLHKELGPSKNGKSTLIANTHGLQNLSIDGVRHYLNVLLGRM